MLLEIINIKFRLCKFFFLLIIRPSEEEILVSRILEKAIKRSRAIDTEGLCIVANEKVSYKLLEKIFINYI